MLQYLTTNEPWAVMFRNYNVVPIELHDQVAIQLSEKLTLIPCNVKHRADFTDTFAFKIHGSHQKLFYCPDIDSWENMFESLPEIASTMDILLLDSTFYDNNELPGRDMRTIPHPRVNETIRLLENIDHCSTSIVFIHINHSNRLWVDKDLIAELEERGMHVGRKGMTWLL